MLARRVKAQFGTLLIGAIGMFFLLNALFGLELGTARRMGPGAFPALAGLMVTVLAFISLIRTFREPADHGIADWRSIIAVAASVAGFILVTPALGVLPGSAACVLLASFAVPELALKRRLVLTAAATLGIWLVFIVALRLPFQAIKGL